ncbi:MAG: SGNH/GDSL hydrolase family protein [Candidatus Binatia bacterium]
MTETTRPILPANKAVAVLLTILAAAGTFFLFEGLASCLLIVDRLVLHAEPVVKERSHCRYDDVLGWVQLPNLDLADQYGPGVFLRTNARGFRGSREVDIDVPAGRTRIVCSGDSFTLGYGVNDDQAWCQLLTALDPRRETVNMGQGGYGADQAYLWYRRDGEPLAHQAQVFAVDTVELERMRRDEFLGYGRPVLQLVDDGLTVTNTPIPRRGYALPWLTQNATSLTELRSMQLLLKIAHRLSPPVAGRSTADTRTVAARMFADLHAINERKGSRLVLVYLPIPTDYDQGDSEPWRRWLEAEAARQHIPYVDLVETLRNMPESGWRALFDPKTGHFSVEGNRRVAQLIAAQLDDVLGRQ